MLKKQTVWLLTMLSLMIVLSVYYMTSPDMGDEAFIGDGLTKSGDVVSTGSEGADGEAKVDKIANVEQDNELYTMLRMDVMDERSKKKDRLEDVVASSSASAEQKNQALSEMDVIDSLATKEVMLEETILAAKEYKDVLVRSDQEKVQIHVKADSLTNQEVVQMMQLAHDEFGNIPVNVNLQPTKK